jgi:D-3-phosphoglycerate dehydrogenase
MKALITTVPFGTQNNLPLKLLEDAGIEYLINPLDKKLTESELVNMISDFDIIIAGTEIISKKVMDMGINLKMISRVGIGLDGVDLISARDRDIIVSYTPDAPAPAVSELTIGMMLTLLRSVHVSNMQMHQGEWKRFFGRRLSECVVGIIGVGRIGRGVIEHLSGFNLKTILLNDIKSSDEYDGCDNIKWVDKETIYKEADIITLHIPLTVKTKGMVRSSHLKSMKHDAIIINTARGGIINEDDLYAVMQEGHLSAAAIDVFNQEPYDGKLIEIERCLLTAHMGSMSIDCRTEMEIKATEEAVRFVKKEELKSKVPESEYFVQQEGL